MIIAPFGKDALDVEHPHELGQTAREVFTLVRRVYPFDTPWLASRRLGDLCFTMTDNNSTVGLVSLKWKAPLEINPTNASWLELLVVAPNSRHDGRGTALLGVAQTLTQNEGLDALGLAAAPGSESFWRHQGFNPCSPQPEGAHSLNPVMYKFL